MALDLPLNMGLGSTSRHALCRICSNHGVVSRTDHYAGCEAPAGILDPRMTLPIIADPRAAADNRAPSGVRRSRLRQIAKDRFQPELRYANTRCGKPLSACRSGCRSLSNGSGHSVWRDGGRCRIATWNKFRSSFRPAAPGKLLRQALACSLLSAPPVSFLNRILALASTSAHVPVITELAALRRSDTSVKRRKKARRRRPD